MKSFSLLFYVCIALLFSGCGGAIAPSTSSGSSSSTKHFSQTPLQQQREYGKVKTFLALLSVESAKAYIEAGYDVNNRDEINDHTMLAWAAQQGNEKLVEYLLGQGADNYDPLAKHNSMGISQSPLAYALNGKNVKVLTLLMNKGYTPTQEQLSKALEHNKMMQEMYKKPPFDSPVFSNLGKGAVEMEKVLRTLQQDGSISQYEAVAHNEILDPYEAAKKENTIPGYQKFIAENPSSVYVKQAQDKIALLERSQKQNEESNKLILEKIMNFLKAKDVEGLLAYANNNPEVMEFAHNQPKIYLLFTGPKELQVGKLLQYKKRGFSDAILTSKIKNLKKPYRKFTLDEIEIMMNLGITDGIVVAMLDVTTQLEDEEKHLNEQKELMQAQKNLINKMNAQQNAPKAQVHQANPNTSNSSSVSNAVADKVIDHVTNKAINSLIDHLF